MNSPTRTLYRLARPEALQHRRWDADDASVIYLSDSRETHLLSPPCGYILATLAQGPALSDALLHALQQYLDCASVAEVQEQLDQIVDTLRRIGILDVHSEAA